MKILGICGSPRRGSTDYSLREALKAAEEAGAETEIITLRGKKISPCIHCNKCIRNEATRCMVFSDDMDEMYDKFFEADGYIIGSPVYEQNITPQLCIFTSRFRANWNIIKNNPGFYIAKLGASLAVGASRNGGQEKTCDAITAFYQTIGVTIISGPAGAYNGALLWAPDQNNAVESIKQDKDGLENARAIGRKMAEMLKTKQ